MLARGSLISAVCILFLLPALLAVFEPVINRTSLHWRTPKAAAPQPQIQIQKENTI